MSASAETYSFDESVLYSENYDISGCKNGCKLPLLASKKGQSVNLDGLIELVCIGLGYPPRSAISGSGQTRTLSDPQIVVDLQNNHQPIQGVSGDSVLSKAKCKF